MTVGSFAVEILSEGCFEFFGDRYINRSPKRLDSVEKNKNISAGNSLETGINPILIQTGNHNILLDTGLGWGLDAGSKYTDVSNVCTNLKIFGLHPEDITHVILTHLHYDHAAGSSFVNVDSKTEPTFPNATYFVHQQEWNYALSQVNDPQNIFGHNYNLDEFYRLASDSCITFLTDDVNHILEGIIVIKTGGHTPGHQVVEINSNGEKAYYLGDLLPNTFHLNEYGMDHADLYSVEAKKQKIRLLKRACKEKAILLFYHSKNGQAGRVFRDKDEKYVLAKQLPYESK